MNPLKKLKLKSQLRNCDYLLAGNVIKQQYYDSNKSTVINRLIDEFMADPGFDNALKLIEYNDMMVFYFTESCDGGLYIRKQDPYKTGPLTPLADSEYAAAEEHIPPPQLDSPLGVSRGDAAVADWRQERQRKILAESEAWMEEMIASGSRKSSQSDEPAEHYDFEPAYDSDTVEEASELDFEETLIMEPVRPLLDDTGYTGYNDSDDRYITDTEDIIDAEEPAMEPDSTDWAADQTDSYDIVSDTADQYTPLVEQSLPPRSQIAAAAEQPEPEAPPIEPAKPKLKKRSYANVIATLQIDIHTMSKQLDEYRQELSFYPSNEKQLIAWIHSLETAIEEFSEVIEMLEDD